MENVLNQQRSKSKINPTELASVIFRSRERFEKFKEFLNLNFKVGGHPDHRLGEMGRVEAYEHAQKLSYNSLMTSEFDIWDEDTAIEEIYTSPNLHYPGGVGSIMTYNLIKNTGTDEQKQDWEKRVKNNVWFTAYAQTEIATGSDVQNLKTVAVYDAKTKEFVFHSPSIESTKWWPGDLGLACSHAAVFARLISNGKDHGVQAFFVELRDPKTHIPHKGVEIGDIGPKLGYKTNDNGFMRFTHFRVPRKALLARYISIDDDGNVARQGNPKIMYTGMMRMRCILLINAYSVMFKAITIGTRYSLYRTQFNDSKGKPIRIYDYQMQREKLFKEIARVYLMWAATQSAHLQIKLNEQKAAQEDFSELQNTHVMLCAFKPYFTWWIYEGVSNIIKACGGHGYSVFSGLPHILHEEFPNMILEGENTVLLLQVARHLLKCLKWVKEDKTEKLTGPFKFFAEFDKWMEYVLPEDESCLAPENILSAFRKSTCTILEKTGLKMFQLVQEHKDGKLVWDTMMGNDLQRLARIFSVLLILSFSWSTISKINEGAIKSALERLFQIGAINLIEEFSSTLLETGVVTSSHISLYFDKKNQLLEELKDDGLILAEGLQWDDPFLSSAIAMKDKDPYETLYNWAREIGTLNQFDNQIHPAVLEYQLKVSRAREEKL